MATACPSRTTAERPAAPRDHAAGRRLLRERAGPSSRPQRPVCPSVRPRVPQAVSPTRVHQRLKADEAREIPCWLSQLHDDGRSPPAADREADPPAVQHPIQTRLVAEVEVLRWGIAWLERLAPEDHVVVVNRRPEREEETAFVPVTPPCSVCVCPDGGGGLRPRLARRHGCGMLHWCLSSGR